MDYLQKQCYGDVCIFIDSQYSLLPEVINM